jgi:outer membrane immunogenic protein
MPATPGYLPGEADRNPKQLFNRINCLYGRVGRVIASGVHAVDLHIASECCISALDGIQKGSTLGNSLSGALRGIAVMKNILLAGTGLAMVGGLAMAGVVPAAAADLRPPPPAPVYTKAPPPPIFNWSGFYIGGNGGYSFGKADTTVTGLFAGLVPIGVPVSIGVSPKGWLGGGQVGYNWQGAGSSWVFGLETDFQATGETDTGSCTVPCVPAANVKNSYPYFGTLRGRIGWNPDHWLLYVTGGLAYAQTQRWVNQLGVVSFQEKPWRFGFTVGGGVEYAFDMHWSVKAEYLYIDYGTSGVTIPASGPLGAAPLGPVTLSTRWTDNVARGGINYRF